jgi:hypothetical protein
VPAFRPNDDFPLKMATAEPMYGPDPIEHTNPMSQPADNSHYVRRVVLPSGRAIEVVYFDTSATPPQTPPSVPTPAEETVDLHICPECDKDLVYPVEWEEASATHWEVALRCPNCEWSTVGVYDQDTVDAFDEELDRGTDVLVRDLKRLTRANMEEEIERFGRALESDGIWPMDF